MNFLVVTTKSHRRLYEDFFLKTLPKDAVVLEKTLELGGDGTYLSSSWQEGVTAKLKWALEFSREHPTETFVLSDVDIQFYAGFSLDDLQRKFAASEADILFQKETRSPVSTEVNTGFYIARSTPWTISLLETAISLCESCASKNDQTAINAMLGKEEHGRKWGHLSPKYYARSQGFPPPRGIVLHHANAAGTVPEKIAQLQRIRRYACGGIIGRCGALASELLDYTLKGKMTAMLARKFWGLVSSEKPRRALILLAILATTPG